MGKRYPGDPANIGVRAVKQFCVHCLQRTWKGVITTTVYTKWLPSCNHFQTSMTCWKICHWVRWFPGERNLHVVRGFPASHVWWQLRVTQTCCFWWPLEAGRVNHGCDISQTKKCFRSNQQKMWIASQFITYKILMCSDFWDSSVRWEPSPTFLDQISPKRPFLHWFAIGTCWLYPQTLVPQRYFTWHSAKL